MSSQEEQMYSSVINTAAQTVTEAAKTAIQFATDLALSRPQLVRASVTPEERDATHDVFDARQMLKEGMSHDDIKIEILQSPAAQECKDPDMYTNCIVSIAERENILETEPPIEISVTHEQDLQL